MKKGTNELIERWRSLSPVDWGQSEFGWIDIDGQPITLSPWQTAILCSWYVHKAGVSTIAISNIKKTGKTLCNSVLLAWRWLCLPGEHFAVANDLDFEQFGTNLCFKLISGQDGRLILFSVALPAC